MQKLPIVVALAAGLGWALSRLNAPGN